MISATCIIPWEAMESWPMIIKLSPGRWLMAMRVGGLIETASPSHSPSDSRLSAVAVKESGKPLDRLADRLVVPRVGRQIPLEHDGRVEVQLLLLRPLLDDSQKVVAAIVRQPGDLERVISLGQAVGVVVNCLARSGQQTGGAVFLAQDEVGVALAALQRDPHADLPQRAAGERIGAAQSL